MWVASVHKWNPWDGGECLGKVYKQTYIKGHREEPLESLMLNGQKERKNHQR